VTIYGPTSSSTSSTASTRKKKLSVGALSGIIVGIILFFAIVAVIVYFAYVAYNRKNNTNKQLQAFVIVDPTLPTIVDAKLEGKKGKSKGKEKKKKYSHVELVTPSPLQEKYVGIEVNASNASHFTSNPQLKKNKKNLKTNNGGGAIVEHNSKNYEQV
jgi:hypothetical protein